MAALSVMIVATAFVSGGTAVAGVALSAQATVLGCHGMLEGRVTVVNTAREAVLAVQARLHFNGMRRTIGSTRRIEARGRWECRFRLPSIGTASGDRPFVVDIAFFDAAHYPHGTLVGGILRSAGRLPPTRLEAHLDDLSMADSGELAVTFGIEPPLPDRVRARLYLPRPLSPSCNTYDIPLRPDGRGRAVFPVQNASAAGEARYPVYCLLEYEEAGIPRTVLRKATVHVRPGGAFWRGYRHRWVAGLAGVIAAGWGLSAILAAGRRKVDRA